MTIGFLLFGIPSALIAARKGFAGLRWILAFGLIGLIVVCCLSSAKAPGITPEESAKRAAKANTVGAWMCGVNLFLGLIWLVLFVAQSVN